MSREIGRCPSCNRSKAACFCGFVRPVRTRTCFVILMHPKEYKRQKTGTGRLTHLSLPNSEIIMGTDFSDEPRLKALLSDPRFHTVLLYPGPGSTNLTTGGELSVPHDKTLLVLVIDATWSLAKKMMRVNAALHSLPKVCFTPESRSRFLIKQQPHVHCLSTIEAVHSLLDALDRQGFERLEGRHSALLDVLDKIVAYQVRCARSASRSDRRPYRHGKPYTPAEDRNPAKKWKRRSVVWRGVSSSF